MGKIGDDLIASLMQTTVDAKNARKTDGESLRKLLVDTERKARVAVKRPKPIKIRGKARPRRHSRPIGW
jgi:hypothetical protein